MPQPTPSSLLNNPSHSTLHNIHFNVKAFGGVGDGSADDTAAITSAIAAAHTAGAGVFFPAGNYKITSTIDLSAYTNLHLVGGASSLASASFGRPPKTNFIDATGTVLPMFLYDGDGFSGNFTFENFGFGNPGCAVKMQNGANVRFKNCAFAVNTNASADNTCVILTNWFWAWFDGCAFNASATTKPSVILRGGAPSPTYDHCLLIYFRDCRFALGGVLCKDQQDILVDIGDLERIVFRDCETESFGTTGALIEFTKTASSDYSGSGDGRRLVKQLDIQGIAFYDYSGTPCLVRLNIPTGIHGATISSIRDVPRLIELTDTSAVVKQTTIMDWTNGPTTFGTTPVVDSGGSALAKNAIFFGAPAGTTASIEFGSDTNLYRLQADTLKTDDHLYVGGNVVVASVSVPGGYVQVGQVGPGAAAGINLGDSADINIYRGGTERLTTDDNFVQAGAGTYHELLENGTTDAAAGGVNTGRLFVRDNGAGKTQLCVRFNTGAVQVIATQP